MHAKKIILFFTLCVYLSLTESCADKNTGLQKTFPGIEWKEKTPESAGVNPVALYSALNYFRTNSGGVGTDEMVILRGGYIIWKGPDAFNYHEIYSCTKIFTSTVFGILATDGKLAVNDLAVKYLPEIDDGNEGQEVYGKLKLIHLATMTGGFNGIATNCWELHLQGLHDESYACTQKYTIPGKPRFAPGTKFSYRDPEVHMLGYILTRVAGNSLEGIFRERVADKIGMTNWDWSDYGKRDGMFFNNPAGTPNNTEAADINEIQGGIWIRPIDFARLGLLYLNKGMWNGEQIIDSTFANLAISNQVPAGLLSIGLDLAGRYGLYWWTNGIRKDGTRAWPSAPPKTATPHGYGRNFCFVIPEWDMVIVRMSPVKESSVPAPADNIWEGFFVRLKDGVEKRD